jgi:uncharacterized protein with GYD domain
VPKFLIEVKYTLDGAKGLVSEGGSSRVAATKTAVESLGGSVETFYFAFGENDAYIIVDLPDNPSAAAATLIARTTGGVMSRMVVLLTPDEIDAAAKKQVNYRSPGH